MSYTAFKSIRQRLGLSQSALADALGMTQGNVHHYERGQTIPPTVAARLIEVAKAKGQAITYDHIYGGQELPPQESPAEA